MTQLIPSITERELAAIKWMLDSYDEFGRVLDPEVSLPPLAERVQGILCVLTDQCAASTEIQELKAEVNRYRALFETQADSAHSSVRRLAQTEPIQDDYFQYRALKTYIDNQPKG